MHEQEEHGTGHEVSVSISSISMVDSKGSPHQAQGYYGLAFRYSRERQLSDAHGD